MPPLTPRFVYRNWEVDGVPDSGKHEPKKTEIVQLLERIQTAASAPAVVRLTKADLDLVTPADEAYGGQVLDDPDPSKNGYYYRSAAVWVRGCGFPDTLAFVTLGGTANAQTGTMAAGVDPGNVLEFIAMPSTPNTGPMTLTQNGVTQPVLNYAGNAMSAGEWATFVRFRDDGAGNYRLTIDANAAASAAQSASDSYAAQLAAEAAAAGAGVTDGDKGDVVVSGSGETWSIARDRKTVALLLVDTVFAYSAGAGKTLVATGDIISAQGFRYEVAAIGATDAHLETSGGVKLRVSIDSGEAHLLAFGVSESASAADNQAALEAWLSCSVDDGAIMIGAPIRVDFASTFTLPGNQIVDWNGLELIKQFDGHGVEFAGGSAVIYTSGRLLVEKGAGGSGPSGSDVLPGNTTAGTVADDHGIVLMNRMINTGELIAWYNQGDGIHISATANMNSARFGFVRAQFNGGHGIGTSGTQNDVSLVSLRARTYGNWKSGFYLADTFPARAWLECFVSAESNAKDATSPSIYLGQAYADSNFKLYAENQETGTADVQIGAASEYINIQDMRVGGLVNGSSKPWSINIQQKTNLPGTTPQEGFVRGGSVTSGDTRYISKLWKGASEATIMERKIFGNGAMHWIPAAGEAAKVGITSVGDLELFGTNKAIYLKSANGTRYRLRVSDAGALTITAVP